MIRSEQFNDNQPEIKESDLLEAARSGGVVISFNTLPLSEDGQQAAFLGVKFVFSDGSVKTALLDRWACSLLCGLASTLEKGQWLISNSAPPGQMRQ